MKMRRKWKYRKVMIMLLFPLFLVVTISCLEQRMVPQLKEISHIQCKNRSNLMIDRSVADVLSETKLFDASQLFYTDDKSYTANTVMVNQICSDFSREITRQLTEISEEKIYIPLGASTGWSFLANSGPKIPFNLIPMGTAKVDYDSSFSSVGINQINYKIWLDISIEIKIVNPLYQENIVMHRKIMLTDIVFSGKVPEHYLQLSYPQEYLLTE